MTTLHIVNGESTTLTLRQTALGGDFLSWGDLLMEGPAVNGLRSAADWAFRAAHLERRFRIPVSDYLRGMQNCRAALDDLARFDEIVLWFEEDWFCQIHLAFILARSGRRAEGRPPFTLVCPDQERLGTLTAARLDQLWAERRPVTPDRAALAAALWSAYAAEEPTALTRLLDGDFRAWPRLRQGIPS
jgi:hypothetical protein